MAKIDLIKPTPRGVCSLTPNKRLPAYMGILTFPFKDRCGRDTFPQAPDMFKQFPGIAYKPKIAKHVWVAPIDAVDFIRETCNILDLDFEYTPLSTTFAPLGEAETKGLYPYQIEDLPKIQRASGFLIAHEMGLGKTAETVRAVEDCGGKILVVCPAVVRNTWRDQIKIWGTKNQGVFIRTRKQDLWEPLDKEQWVITSYEGLTKEACKVKWKIIVCDESAFLKNQASGRTKRVKDLRKALPFARVLELSGTPIADTPSDLWQQLDILYPDRYGTFFRFKKRYCNAIPCPYAHSGWVYRGLNDEHAPELKERLSLVSSRVTKDEVAHLLPPLTVTANRLPAEGFLSPDDWDDQGAYDEWCHEHADVKIKAVKDWAESALEGAKNVLIFTYLRRTAKTLSELLNGTCITGELEPETRNRTIKDALKKPGALVCTIASVGIGIDSLAGISVACFAELDYYPTNVLQALARVHRLSSKYPVSVTLFIFEGTVDEKIALALDSKLQDANKILKSGVSEKKVLSALEFTPQNWEKHMKEVAAGKVEDLWEY